MRRIEPPTLADIEAARERIRGIALRTPLVRLHCDDTPAEIYLKLENLQPIGSFKLRGAGNAMRLAGDGKLRNGVYTASAGNMAQGVAWNARQMGVPCEVVVPDHAPRTKLDAIKRLGGRIIRLSSSAMRPSSTRTRPTWQALVRRRLAVSKSMATKLRGESVKRPLRFRAGGILPFSRSITTPGAGLRLGMGI